MKTRTTLVGLLASLAPMVLPATGVAATTECPAPALSHPFAPFGDDRPYTLAPGGSFEAGEPEWKLKDGARVVAGNEPWDLNSASDKSSLYVAPGATARSPVMCVDLDYSHFRMPIRALDPSGDSKLIIEVKYPDAPDDTWNRVATERGGDGWRITGDIQLKPETFSGEAGARRVRIRFRASDQRGDRGWLVDDVFVDPRMRG